MISCRDNTLSLLTLLLLSVFIVTGCSSSGGNISQITKPFPREDISGVWLGFLNNNKIFTVGIIIPSTDTSYDARLIGAGDQFLAIDDFPIHSMTNSAVFQGNLKECVWNASGPDYSNEPTKDLFMEALGSTRGVIGAPFGAYFYTADPTVSFSIALYYNTTYEVPPNVNNISGQWEMQDAVKAGNTLVLTITPNTTDTKRATISGKDDRGNSFDGTITIHVNPLDVKPRNVYDVNVTLTNTNNSIDLTGLATYVLNATTHGVGFKNKAFVIGVTSNDKSFSLSGFANFKD
jgi:hypothetical protein